MRRLILLLIGALLWAGTATAQTVMPTPYQTFLDNAGHILPSGCIWTYQAGTTTAAATYTDSGLITPNANPIIADSAGRFVAYLAAAQSYKFVYEATPCSASAHGTTIKTVDNVSTVPSGSVNVDITGTAGEAISAGASVYLSDGSGSKVAGQWYNASSTNAYSSSSALQIGMAPLAVLSGATGTFRISGRMTGLSGITAGAYVYIGSTAGTYTATAPANARVLGAADSTTSLVVGPTLNVTTQPIDMADGRLTCTTAVPVTVTDCNGVATLYYTPYLGNRIALYNGSGLWYIRTFSEITISVSTCTASTPYDVFLYDNAGTVTAETLAWTNATTRATALATQNGVYVKSGATTRRYVGSFYCNGTGGQTDDAAAKRDVWNYYHRVRRPLLIAETTDNWTYTTAAYRQANGSAANQVEVMVGVAETPIHLYLAGLAANSTGGVAVNVNIGEDGTSPLSGPNLLIGIFTTGAANAIGSPWAMLDKYPAVGRHYYTWLEYSVATGTTTWRGDDGAPTRVQSGMVGWIEG